MDNLAYAVDRSGPFARHMSNEGETFPSKHTKMHRHIEGDCLAVCSSRILTHWPEPGWLPADLPREDLCRRCFPESNDSQSAVGTNNEEGN
jgi:hypothetical protein